MFDGQVHPSLTAKAALIGALLLGGCGLLPEQVGETAGWNAQSCIPRPRPRRDRGGYDRAVTLFESSGTLSLRPLRPAGAASEVQPTRTTSWRAGARARRPTASSSSIPITRTSITPAPQGPGQLQRRPRPARRPVAQGISERDPKGAREAFDSFRELVERLTESRYADDSRARMQYLINSLASHEVRVSLLLQPRRLRRGDQPRRPR